MVVFFVPWVAFDDALGDDIAGNPVVQFVSVIGIAAPVRTIGVEAEVAKPLRPLGRTVRVR